MPDLSVTIGGDLGPFIAVAAQLRQQMQAMSRTVRTATRSTGTGAREAAGGFGVLKSAASATMSAISASARGAMRAINGLGSSLKSLVPSMGGLGPIAGALSIAGGVMLAFSQLSTGIDVAGNIEQTSIALEALTGSGTEAKRILAEMRNQWLRTGQTIENQSQTIRKFIALGFSPDDAMKLNRNLLDVSGAVGLTEEETTLLAEALSQVKGKGVVAMEELRKQIGQKGVPIFEALAAKLNITQAQLMKLVETGKVPAQALLDIFMNMEGAFSKFSGGAGRMGATFLGIVSRLKGAWQLFVAEFVAPIMDSLKPVLLGAISMLESWKSSAAEAGKTIGNALLAAFALIKDGKAMDLLAAGINIAVQGAIDLLMRGLRGAIAFLATALPPVFMAAMSVITDPQFWEGIKVFLRGVAAGFSAQFNEAAGKPQVAAALNQQMETDQRIGTQLISRSGKGADIGTVIADALFKGGAAATKAFSEGSSPGLEKSKSEAKTLLDSVKSMVEDLRKTVVMPGLPSSSGSVSSAPKDMGIGDPKHALGFLTTSLNRVGGGGFGTSFIPMVTEQKKGNLFLERIATNTSKLKTPAVIE